MSARGWRFTQRYGDRLTYIEADLPGMTARKRRALEQMGSLNDRHRDGEVEALCSSRPNSISALAAELDRESGLAIITEGLLGYLDTDAVDGIWRRFARTLSTFPSGRYISDLHLGSVQNAQIRAFRAALSVFVRSQVHLHFDNAEQAEAALAAAARRRLRLSSRPQPGYLSPPVRRPGVPVGLFREPRASGGRAALRRAVRL